MNSGIGETMVFDPLSIPISTCGKEWLSVPVGVGQPTLRIDGLTVGGQFDPEMAREICSAD